MSLEQLPDQKEVTFHVYLDEVQIISCLNAYVTQNFSSILD